MKKKEELISRPVLEQHRVCKVSGTLHPTPHIEGLLYEVCSHAEQTPVTDLFFGNQPRPRTAFRRGDSVRACKLKGVLEDAFFTHFGARCARGAA